MTEENQDERTYYEMSIENDNGSQTKFLEIELLSPIKLEPSEGTDKVTLSLSFRIQALQPITIDQSTFLLTLNREMVQRMAERLGLISS